MRGFWDLSGGYQLLVCSRCGTCHRINHLPGLADELLAQQEPMSVAADFVGKPLSLGEWQSIMPLPTDQSLLTAKFNLPVRVAAVDYSRMSCTYCNAIGTVVNHDGRCHSDDSCPRCGEQAVELQCVTS